MNRFNYYIGFGILIILLGNYSDTPSFFPLYLNFILGGGIILYSLFQRKNIKQERIKFNWKKSIFIGSTGLLLLIIVRISIKHFAHSDSKYEKKGFIYSSEKDTLNENSEKKLDSILNSN